MAKLVSGNANRWPPIARAAQLQRQSQGARHSSTSLLLLALANWNNGADIEFKKAIIE